MLKRRFDAEFGAPATVRRLYNLFAREFDTTTSTSRLDFNAVSLDFTSQRDFVFQDEGEFGLKLYRALLRQGSSPEQAIPVCFKAMIGWS